MLQMRVYKEIANVEAKVMWGLGWRQLAAAACMLVLGGGVVLVVAADGPRLVSAVRGVSAVRAVGLVASEGTEAGTVSGIHAAPTFRPEGVSARTPCSREIPRQTVVEGEDP